MRTKFPSNNKGHPSLYISLRSGIENGSSKRYAFSFNSGGTVYFNKRKAGANDFTLTSASLYIQADKWYAIDILVDGNRIVIAVDSQQLIDYTDTDSPLLSGNIMLETWDSDTVNFTTSLGGATKIFIDDLTVFGR